MHKNKKNFPLVSVIMNCHNGEKYLKQSIESLISQTYTNWELIFWDNGSKDRSKQIFKSFKDTRLKYFFNKEKTTLYKARNLGIYQASGEFLTFLDTDDFWINDRLKKQLDYFTKFPDIHFIYGNYYIYNEKLNSQKIAYKNSLKSGKIYNFLLENYNVGLVSICLKKKILIKFDERFDIIGDFDSIMKLSKIYDFGFINEPLSYYRFHENNFSLLNKDKHYNELSIWYNENIKNNNKITIDIKKKFEIQIDELKIISLILSKNKIKALELIFKKVLLLKKIKFIIFLILPIKILKKFINR
tara:strand:- start:678 stop:1580 length:903 start_codon:yes stop_codon:yes gene_type:complete